MIGKTQATPALTRNGNPYRPSRLGMTAGAAMGAVGAIKVISQDKRLGNLVTTAAQDIASKNAKGIFKGLGKAGLALLAVGTTISALVGLGSLVGNLIDAPMNKELKEQADGEAALQTKAEMQDYLATMINEMNQNEPKHIDYAA